MGRETALLFSQKDYTIVGVDINEATLKETIERTGQNKDKALGIPADVTKVEELKTVAEKLRARFGRLDILINCVGQFAAQRDYWNSATRT